MILLDGKHYKLEVKGIREMVAFMDDHGDMVDTLVIKTCANRRCNRLLGYK